MSLHQSLLREDCQRSRACRQHGFAHPMLLQRNGEESIPCSSPSQDSGRYRSISPVAAERNDNFTAYSTLGTELVAVDHVPSIDEFSVSLTPHIDRDAAHFTCGTNDVDCSCAPCPSFADNGPRHFPASITPSHCSILASQQDTTYMPDTGLCNGLSREQHCLFQNPLRNIRHKVKKKKEMKGFSLPDSLARSFDSSEMEKIATAIVRVNECGLSTLTNRSGSSSPSRVKHTTPRVLPSVGAFTVQCGNCFKWRLIPSKEQYEQIRQNVLEKPFYCTSWRPGASCGDPPELGEDSKLLWAIDKPNIPLPPNGWERLLAIRGEGGTKFADIYYVSPSGKKLRSMPEIERYLLENPELVNGGASLSQFSFATPKALEENYCRKRSAMMRGSMSVSPTNITRPQDGQSFSSVGENAPIAVEPLRAWDPDHHALMICHR